MKPLILLVDDNPEILKNLKFTLVMNDYDVITAENGNQALNILKNENKPPDLIISDILMPKMNGYSFFEEISSKPYWNSIPFIFLSAKSSPEDIRIGKALGVDDYFIKPFNPKDLLASIKGKLFRREIANSVEEKVKSFMETYKYIRKVPDDEKDIKLINVIWDDDIGPVLKEYYPKEEEESYDIIDVSVKLFNGMVLIYGHEDIQSAEGLLIKIERIDKYGYIFFDAYPDKNERSGQKRYMIGIIAPSITYFESLELKEIAQEISSMIKAKISFEIKDFWNRIKEIL